MLSPAGADIDVREDRKEWVEMWEGTAGIDKLRRQGFRTN